MSIYNLKSNESVIMNYKGVRHGSGLSKAFGLGNELTLTNLNLIVTTKGLFGKVKSTLCFPVNQITSTSSSQKEWIDSDGEYNDTSELTIHISNSAESFAFRCKDEAAKWENTISKLLAGKGA